MDKANLSLSILAGIGLVGTFVLLGLDKPVDVVLPITTFLCGAVATLNREAILGVFKKK